MNLSPTVKTTYRMSAPASAKPETVLRSSRFKYYIHDGIDACRFQLLGELTEADIPELTGCWRTARTTLGERKLVLDLRGLKTIDDVGIRWVTSMAEESAVYVPSPHLPGLSFKPSLTSLPVEPTRKAGRVGKLAAILRTFRLLSPESSTPAQ